MFAISNLKISNFRSGLQTATGRFAVNWPKSIVAARFLQRLVFGFAALAGIFWFANRVQRIDSQREFEISRATGLSAVSMWSGSSKAPMLAKDVLPQTKSEQIGVMTESTRIARTASLRVSVTDFSAARESVERIVRARGGFTASMTISSPKDSSRSLSADIAIPTAQCDAALQEIRLLGRVEEERQGTEEVTAQSEDLDIRLRNMREAETRLMNILRTGAGKISDILDVENEITRVRGEIEHMEAEQKRLNNRIVFASIALNVTEEFRAEPGIASSRLGLRMRNAFIDGYRGAVDGFLDVLEFFSLRVRPWFSGA